MHFLNLGQSKLIGICVYTRSEMMVYVFSLSHVNNVKFFPNLVSPLVDDRHVDIIYENGHFLPSRGPISGPHPLIHIALNCSLKGK